MNKKPILVFGAILLLSIAIYAWTGPLNKGTLTVSTDQSNYLVFIGSTSNDCASNRCDYELKPGTYAITLRKDGYFPYTEGIGIKRGSVININTSLERIPSLEISPIIPEQDEDQAPKPFPSDIPTELGAAWNATKDQVVYLDPTDNRLKVWKNGKTQLITVLRNISDPLSFLWSPDNNKLIATINNDVYFIEIEAGSRLKQVMNLPIKNTNWATDDTLIGNDSENNLIHLTFSSQTLTNLEHRIDLEKAAWKNPKNLVYYRTDGREKETIIENLNIDSNEITEIIRQKNLPISQIVSDESGMIYVLNESDQIWYQLSN